MLGGLAVGVVLAIPGFAKATAEPSDLSVDVEVYSGHHYRTSIWVQLDSEKPCNNDGKTVVKFTNAGHSTENRTGWKCDHIGRSQRDRTSDWIQKQSLGGSDFRPTFEDPGRHVFTLSVKFKGKMLVSGRFAVVVNKVRDRERIDEDQDAFVNYCINHNAEIRSDNGHLYCWRPAVIRQRIRDVELHRNVPSI